MKKNILYTICGIVGIFLIIILAGIYKFNFTNDDIYVNLGNEEIVKYDELKNITISIPDSPEIKVQLLEGSAEFTIPETTAVGFATLSSEYAVWERENRTDFVSILNVNYGGSGTFQYLLLFDVADGVFVQKSEALLGDRIAITKVGIGELVHDPEANYRVTVQTLVRNEGEPFVTTPTKPETRTFYVTDQALEEVEVGRDDS
ncbi:hypothetical protein ACFL6I_10620 [candidate division KSB1 bacterium]